MDPSNKVYPKDTIHVNPTIDGKYPKEENRQLSNDIAALRTQVFHACQDGNIALITFLGEYAVPRLTSFDIVDVHGASPLHYASKGGHTEIVQFLLDRKVDINIKDNKGQRPLHYATRFKQSQATLLLASHRRTRIDAKDDMKMTALLWACKRGYTEIAKILLARGASASARGREEITTLHFPCLMGNTELVQILIEHGAPIDGADVNETTPIMSAATGGSVEIMELLLTRTQKRLLSDKDSTGSTALHYAIQCKNLPFVDACLLRKADITAARNDGNTGLHIAVSLFFNDFISRAIEYQCDLNMVDEERKTPLHNCAQNNNINGAKLLLSGGGYVNAPDYKFATPVHYCAEKGYLPMLQCFSEYGANFSARNELFQTPLHLAVINNHKEIINFLLQKMDVAVCNFVDFQDRTALHYAAEKGYLDTVQLLVKKEVSLTEIDLEDRIPLHLAIYNGHMACLQFLITRHKLQGTFKESIATLSILHAAGQSKADVFHYVAEQSVDVGARDESGRNTLMNAAFHGNVDILNFLLQRDMDINSVDIQRNTALHYASKGDNANCVRILLNHGARITENSLGQSPFDLALRQNSGAAEVFIEPSYLAATMNFRYHNGASHMQSMITSNPNISKSVMESCVTESTLNHLDPEYTVRYDFRYIDPGPDDRCSRFFWERYFAMEDIVKYGCYELMEHPLMKVYLNRKWTRIGGPIYFFDLLLYMAFLVALTVYYMNNTPPLSKSSYLFLTTDTGCPVPIGTTGTTLSRDDGAPLDKITQYVLWVLLGIRLSIELLKLFTTRISYFTCGFTYINMALYVSTTYFIRYPNNKPCVFEWRGGIVSIFLAWLNFILQWDQVYYIGIYVLMFEKIFLSILKVAPMYMILAFAFALAFRTTLSPLTPFANLSTSFIKTVDMSIGELEYVSYFLNNDTYFTEVGYVLFVVFTLLMCILMMNLLIGVAVGDIGNVMAEANDLFTAKMIRYIINIETKIPKFVQRLLYEPEYFVKPNHDKSVFVENIKESFNDLLGRSQGEGSNQVDLIGKQLKELEQQMLARFENLEKLLAAGHK